MKIVNLNVGLLVVGLASSMTTAGCGGADVGEGFDESLGYHARALDGLPAPVPVSPTQGQTLGSTTTTFSWNGPSNATSYVLWVQGRYMITYTDLGALGCSGGGLCTTPALTLTPGSTLYQVQARVVAGGTWSVPVYFTIPGTSLPARPSAISPVGTATSSQVFTWTRSSGATSYQLWVQGYANLSYDTSACNATECSSGAIALPPGTTIWQVAAKNATGASWSAATSITVAGTPAPSRPSAISPIGTAATSQTFTWSIASGATSYTLWVQGVGNYLYDTTVCGAADCTSPSITLPPGTTLWQVAATNATGTTWSTATTITVPGQALPGKPTLVSPLSSAEASQIFTWNEATGTVDQYVLWVQGVGFYYYQPATCTSGVCNSAAIALPVGSRVWQVGATNASGTNWSTAPTITVSPYRHTIVINGANDFSASETFQTTSDGYSAYASWDSNNLYIGYSGSDISPSAQSNFVLIYLDTNPGGTEGSPQGFTYRTQTAGFTSPFLADIHLGWKTNGSYTNYSQFNGAAWVSATNPVQLATANNFVEFAIPLSALGNPSKVGVVALMINEADGSEWSYAGLYPGSFTDGYHSTMSVAHYLLADFASAAVPNATTNMK